MPSSETEERTEKYYPPTHDVFVQFAQNIGNELGEAFTNDEVVQGLADFLAVVAKTLANNLNRKIDNVTE